MRDRVNQWIDRRNAIDNIIESYPARKAAAAAQSAGEDLLPEPLQPNDGEAGDE